MVHLSMLVEVLACDDLAGLSTCLVGSVWKRDPMSANRYYGILTASIWTSLRHHITYAATAAFPPATSIRVFLLVK